MMLNTHERWLLRLVGLTGDDRRDLLAALVQDGRTVTSTSPRRKVGTISPSDRSERHRLPTRLSRRVLQLAGLRRRA